MIKVGIVGVGGISRVHLDAYRDISDAQLVAAADISGESAKQYEYAKKLGVKFYTGIEEMLENEQLDMLDICTPTPYHAQMVNLAFSRGLHVISEKPMARTSAECEELVRAAAAQDKYYMVAHVVRFMKPYKYLASVVRSGELGRPVHLFMRRLSTVPDWSWNNWMHDRSLSGGAALDLSIHDLDFVASVFGEPREVSAVTRDFGSMGLNDYICSELVYDGFNATVIGAFYEAKMPFTAEYLAVFERGVVELKGGKVYRCSEEINLDDPAEVGEDTGINVSGSSAYTDEIAYFIDCIKRGEAPSLVSAESSAYSVKLVERLRDAAIKV